MRAKTLQVHWHSQEPVFSLDFGPDGLLATAGADKTVKMWQIEHDAAGEPHAVFRYELDKHSAAVNAVRYSPGGDKLATGADGGELFFWRPAPGEAEAAGLGASANAGDPAFCWRQCRMERTIGGDVQDLAWAPDGTAGEQGPPPAPPAAARPLPSPSPPRSPERPPPHPPRSRGRLHLERARGRRRAAGREGRRRALP